MEVSNFMVHLVPWGGSISLGAIVTHCKTTLMHRQDVATIYKGEIFSVNQNDDESNIICSIYN
jgi:hypothetical protein